MPIGDLLASITGEKPAPSVTTTTRPSLAIPKRKAEEDLRGVTVKTPRTDTPTNGSLRQNGTYTGSAKPSPRPLDRLTGGSASTDKLAVTHRSATRPISASSASASTQQRPAASKSAPSLSRSSSSNAIKPLPSRPLANRPRPAASSGPKSEPKKRSFQEIMARAHASSAVRESFGKIQHKPLEKSAMTTKDRKDMKAEEGRKMKNGSRNGTRSPAPPPAKGAVAPSRYSGTSANRTSSAPVKSANPSNLRRSGSAPAVEEKKVKKAAVATTGYTGTARARPGGSPRKAGAARSSLAAKPRNGAPYGGSTRRYDDYDDDLDDFVEYDDDEDEHGYGRGGGYASDETDDMEAGMGDIDEEERRAEAYARREDQEQEALEKRLKREKEEKRQRILNAVKAKAAARA
ncbi:hypothetical protein B0T17DRAFT_522821 [Bombardia bombarda]|uniref:SPT2 chromatin protein n=1 Tax=Bombardia bombarda TaxID=252184 RepID=A0AA39X7R5_9PEZI|nr:hypothetical protein B0T17DRAFT_522821 [Bombardia bombarda]